MPMHDDNNMENMYILCGLSNEASDEIREALTEAAKEKGYNAVCVSRYRKEGIRQFISEHKEFRILVLQEAMQTNYPYTAEELAELADDFHLNIVISIKKSHRANQYMKVLYTAGILNALYEEDATAENIMTRILYPRTRRECRAYYQISTAADAMRSLEIVDEERLKGYLSYLDESYDDSEMRSKYRYIAQSLKPVENIYLVQNLSEKVRQVLSAEEVYQEIINLQEKKKRWPFGKRSISKKKQQQEAKLETVSFPGQISSCAEREGPEAHSRENHAIEDMLDEDISDLLGFGNEVRLSKQQTAEICSSVISDEEQRIEESKSGRGRKQTGKEHRTQKRSNLIRNGIIIMGILLFLALVILFGFFLYSESQKKEMSEPIVYEQDTDNKSKLDQKIKTEEKSISPKAEEKEKNEEKTEGADQGRETEQEETAAATETTGEKVKQRASSKRPEEKNTQAPQYTQEVQVETEPPEPVIEQVEQPPAASQEQETEKSYNGCIVTGAEVQVIAKNEEAKGNRLYIKTRDRGEGFFSAAEISGMVDGTCSYLVQIATAGQLSFIQQ